MWHGIKRLLNGAVVAVHPVIVCQYRALKHILKRKPELQTLKKKYIANEILSGVDESISLTELQCLHENTKKENSKQGRMNILCREHQRAFFF